MENNGPRREPDNKASTRVAKKRRLDYDIESMVDAKLKYYRSITTEEAQRQQQLTGNKPPEFASTSSSEPQASGSINNP